MQGAIPILVTAGGGIIGEGIIKSLRLANSKGGPVSYRILVADADARAAGLYRADQGFILPRASDPRFIDSLIGLAKENQAKAIFVGADEELSKVGSAAARIKRESGAVVISNKPEAIRIGSDKWKTFEFMKRHGLPRAESSLPEKEEDFVREFGYPLVVKPREGHGSEGFFIVTGKQELQYAMRAIRGRGWRPVLQEYLAGEDNEYTTGVTLGRGSKVMSSIAMRRTLKGGQTYKAFVEDFADVRSAAERLALALGGTGPINIQSRMVDGEPKAFEINPRFSASCPIRAVAGVNEPDILFRNLVLGETLRVSSYQRMICLRYWNETYVAYRDFESAKTKGHVEGPTSKVGDSF